MNRPFTAATALSNLLCRRDLGLADFGRLTLFLGTESILESNNGWNKHLVSQQNKSICRGLS